MRKGQVELVAILGIIVVVVVIAYFALSGVGPGPAAPSGIQQEQLQVKNSIENLIRSGAEETLRTVSLYGGYDSPEGFALGSVELNGREVPYWSYQGSTNIPDLQTAVSRRITDYIRSNKAAMEQSLENQEVVIGDPSVGTRMLANQLIVDVNMQVSVRGYPIAGPYSVSVPTKMGEVQELSQKLVNHISSSRFFEDVTLYQIIGSRFENGVQVLPILVNPVSCGRSVYLDWYSLQPEMEAAVRSALAHTYMPGQYPLNVGDKTSYMKFSLPALDGKEYLDIPVSFHTPDGFELTSENFQFAPNPITAIAEPVPLTGACAAEPVYVNYYVLYPGVAQIKDPLTGNLFRFAFQVFMKNNQPGSWGEAGYISSEQAAICADTSCPARIEVKDSEGNALPYASIRFMDCGYRADGDGVFEGNVPCGIGSLVVRVEGYGMYDSPHSSDDLLDMDLTVYRQPLVNLFFHEVSVQNDSLAGNYIIDPDGIKWIRNDIRPEEAVTLSFISKETGQEHQRIYTATSDNIQLPPGDYYLGGILSSQDLVSLYGGFNQEITLAEDTKSLHLYIPYSEGFSQMTDNNTIMQSAAVLSRILRNCSVGPVSETPVALSKSCYIKYGELG